MSDFMQDYVLYHSYYEIPRNYVYWCGIGLIGAIVNRKVCFHHGDIIIHGNLYIMLVGPQGLSKSVPCTFARQFFKKVCPDMPIGASTQSAEDIVANMSKDDFARAVIGPNGEPLEIRAYAFFINEFKNFVSYSPARMLSFLTDIYDRADDFDSSTIKRGVENIPNPSLNILACENPDWLVNNLKNDIVSGGFSRRIIYVYETLRAEPKAFIDLDATALLAKDRIVQRLTAAKSVCGIYKWTESGRKFYKPWYDHKQKNLPTNALMAGYMGTKHIQLFKVAMALDAVSDKPMLLFTDDLLIQALAFLDNIEENMPKLSLAAGRNELAPSQQRILEFVKAAGGCITEREVRRHVETDLNWRETMEVIRHLTDTDQLISKTYRTGGKDTLYLLTPAEYNKRIKKEKEKQGQGQTNESIRNPDAPTAPPAS